MTEMVWWPETDYDELQRRRESSRQVNKEAYEAYTTEENCGGELLEYSGWRL
ncbi:hypothetical protein Bca101_039241 [Brassica carinata]